MPTETPDAQEPQEITEVEVVEASIEPGGLGEIEVDITENLSEDQVRDLFAAFNDEDWAEVDRLTEEFEKTGVYTDNKAGGADRNRGSAEKLRRYWTVGVGGQKIRWGTPGDFRRCVALVSKHLGPRAKGYCALRHKEVNGYYPGDKRNKALLSLSPSPVVLSHASAAVPSPGGSDTTHLGLIVTPLTDTKTTSFPDVPPSDVLSVGDRFKVIGADAVPYAAEVVDLKAIGDGTDVEGICQLVRPDQSSVKSLDASVSFPVNGPGEEPAPFVLLDLRFKSASGVAGRDRLSDVFHVTARAPESVGVRATHSTLLDRASAIGNKALIHGGIVAYVSDAMINKSDSPDLEASDPAYHEAKEDVEPMIEHDSSDGIEFKVVSLKGMNVVDAEKGIVETIISVTGIVDNVKDRILPGAYSKTLAKRKPKGVWSHDWDTPVSKTLDVKELLPGDPELPKTMPDGDPWPSSAGALKVKTQFNLDTQRGREAYSDVVFFADEQEWCADEDTEILTSRGWVRYDDLTTDDQAYVLDPQLNVGRFEPVLAVNVWDAKPRQMRRIETGGHSSLTTAAHRWPVATNREGGHVEWKTTETLDYRDRFYRAAPRLDGPDEPKWTDAFVSLVAWYWCEGWDDNNGGLYLAQSTTANPQHVAAIRGALQSAFPGWWSEHHSSDEMARFRLPRQYADMIRSVTGTHKQPTPEFLTSLTRSQLVLFVQTCLDGDGHQNKRGQRTWYQVADESVRAFEMACALAGIPTVTTPQKDYGNRYGRPPQRVSLLRSGVAKPLDAIRVKQYGYKTGNPRTPAVDEWVEHDGIVWCPTTPSGTWLARRRGTVYFTGNSIGYNVPVGGAKVDQKSGIREIETLELYEYSPVLFGAMPLARTTSVKEAQLAMKALRGGAASWLSEAVTEEVTPAGPDAEEKDVAAELDEYELPGDQMVLVKRAISTLTDLLSVVQGAEFKSDEPEDEEEAAETPEEDTPAEEAEEEVTEYDSLSSAVSDMVEDPDLKTALVDAAKPVDSAIESDDAEGMDAATSKFLDVVESALGEGKSSETLKEIALMLADLIENVVGDGGEEMPNEDNIEKKEPEEKSDTISTTAVQDGNVVLNTDEITSLLDSLK